MEECSVVLRSWLRSNEWTLEAERLNLGEVWLHQPAALKLRCKLHPGRQSECSYLEEAKRRLITFLSSLDVFQLWRIVLLGIEC